MTVFFDSAFLTWPRKPSRGSGSRVLHRVGSQRLADQLMRNLGLGVANESIHKNCEDNGRGAASGASVSFTGASGRKTAELIGSKELVRVRLTVAPSSSLIGDDIGVFYYRFLQPVWFESVES